VGYKAVTTIPDTDHVARYCSPSKIGKGKIQATAFHLKISRTPPEDYLSVNWLEHLHATDRLEQIAALKPSLKAKLPHLNNSAKIAVLNVGTAKTIAADVVALALSVKHIGHRADISYSGIWGPSEMDHEVVAQLLAEVVQYPLYDAK